MAYMENQSLHGVGKKVNDERQRVCLSSEGQQHASTVDIADK